jgi:hypothetical protein
MTEEQTSIKTESKNIRNKVRKLIRYEQQKIMDDAIKTQGKTWAENTEYFLTSN